MNFRFPECDKLSPPILQLDDVTFYYNKDKILFDKVCVNANMDSRICIVSILSLVCLKVYHLHGGNLPTSGMLIFVNLWGICKILQISRISKYLFN